MEDYVEMKKLICSLLFLSVLTSTLFAAPSDAEVETTFAGAFTVFGTIMFVQMMSMEIDGFTIEMNMETGMATAVFDNLDVEELFGLFGDVSPTDGEIPDIPFSTMSGTFVMDAEQDLDMDLSFGGGPVKTMRFKTEGEEVIHLTADGRNYSHIGDSIMMMDYAG